MKPASSASLPQGKPDEPQGVPLTAMDMDKEAKTGNPGIDKGKIDKSEMDKMEKCDKNAANRDVLALMELKPEVGFAKRGVKSLRLKIHGGRTLDLHPNLDQAPLILRREQLSAPFRAGDDGETEDAEMPDGEGDGDHKSDHGEEEGDDPVLKKPAARRSRAKAKAKATAKAKAKAAAKAKAKAGAKAKAAAKAVPEAKAKTSRKSVANADGDTGAKEKGRRPAATFAKRWKPDNEEGAARFLAIRDVFMSHIAPKLQAQSSFQELVFVCGWDQFQSKTVRTQVASKHLPSAVQCPQFARFCSPAGWMVHSLHPPLQRIRCSWLPGVRRIGHREGDRVLEHGVCSYLVFFSGMTCPITLPAMGWHG